MTFYAAYALRHEAGPDDIFDVFGSFEEAFDASHALLVDDDDAAVLVNRDEHWYKILGYGEGTEYIARHIQPWKSGIVRIPMEG